MLYVDSLVVRPRQRPDRLAVVHDWALRLAAPVAALVAGAAIPPDRRRCVRARWAHLLPDARERHTAFAVESVADEVVFVTGPTLVTFLSTLWAPRAGLVAAVVVGTVGALGLAVQRGTEPPAHPRHPTRHGRRADAVAAARCR